MVPDKGPSVGVKNYFLMKKINFNFIASIDAMKQPSKSKIYVWPGTLGVINRRLII